MISRALTSGSAALVAGCALAALAAALAAGIAAGPGGAAVGGRLAFAAKRDSAFEISVVNANGTGLRRLAAGKDPSWSPDGKRIAYAAPSGQDWDIYLMNADGSGQRRLAGSSTSLDLEPAWSPDGTRIAFASRRGDTWAIYIANVDGSDVWNLSGNSATADLGPTWSPDAREVAFESFNGSRYELDVVNADGTSERSLVKSPTTDDLSPAWSPDGTTIAFARFRDGNADLFAMPADGGAAKVLAAGATSHDLSPSWSPDGKTLSFRRVTGIDKAELYLVGVGGGEPVKIPLGPALTPVGAARWQPLPGSKPIAAQTPTPAIATMPDVVGLPLEQARLVLQTAGVAVSIKSYPSNRPKDTVIAQARPKGAKVARGDRVQINVSSGEKPGGGSGPATTMPNVVGLTLENARLVLRGAGLVASIKFYPSNLPQNTVIAQARPYGTALHGGDQVQVNVSNGAKPGAGSGPPTTMPDVVGLPIDQARAALKQAGIVASVVYYPSIQPAGTVIAQAKAAGTAMRRGDHVQINASNGKRPGK